MRYVPYSSILMCVELFCASSLCYSLGRCLLVQDLGDTQYCTSYDSPRFPYVWGCHCHPALVDNHHIFHVYELSIYCRFSANRLLLSPPSHSSSPDSKVEWAYAFDVHTNAFFPLYLTLYLAQLFLLPIILKDNWVCIWIGNTLYLAA